MTEGGDGLKTIRRHWPTTTVRGDYQGLCDYCGVQWRRSQLIRDASGKLACPDDQAGLDEVTLTEANAAAAGQNRQISVFNDGANYDNDDGLDDPPQRTTAADIGS